MLNLNLYLCQAIQVIECDLADELKKCRFIAWLVFSCVSLLG